MTYLDTVVNQWEDDQMLRTWPNKVKTEMMQWVASFRWDIFWTQTFRVSTSASGARTMWLRFLADFNSRLAPVDQSGVINSVDTCLWVTEPHQSFPSNHVHALLSMRRPISLTTWKKEWRRWKEAAWKRLGKAFLVQTNHNAPIWYVLKYLTKDARGIQYQNLPVYDRKTVRSSTRRTGADPANMTTGSARMSTTELTRLTKRRSCTSPPPQVEKTWGIWTPTQSSSSLLDQETLAP